MMKSERVKAGGIREILSRWRTARNSERGDARVLLEAIYDEVQLTSPQVYESGMITRLDLRLVNLY